MKQEEKNKVEVNEMGVAIGVDNEVIEKVRVAKVDDDKTITPAMRQSINKARREYAKGETITCRTPEEMQKYFDSL